MQRHERFHRHAPHTPREPDGRRSRKPDDRAADPRFAQYKVIRRNGAVVRFEPAKIAIAMTKAFLAVNGGQGAASARVREQVTKAHRCRRRGADEAQARRRRDPHRGDPGPGRARADARRRARGRARLRALPRAPRAGARAGEAAKGGEGSAGGRRSTSSRTASRKPLDLERLTQARPRIVRGPAPRSSPSASSRRR